MTSKDFACHQPPYVLTVVNGEEDGTFRVTGARILIDGIEIFHQSDFKKKVEQLDSEVTISETSILRIEMSGKPGTYVYVYVTGEMANCIDPIVHYPFDGNADDASGNGYNATLHGVSPTIDRYGNPNSAYYFDGGTDWIEAGLNVKDPTGSISLWFKAEMLEDVMLFCQIHHPYEASTMNYNLSPYSDGYGLFDVRGVENIQAGFYAKDVTTLNEWHHIVCIWGESGVRLYMDGVLQGSSDLSYYDNSSTVNMGIGCYNGHHPRAHYFHGSIDDFRIYNVQLSESEVLDLYNE